MRRVNTRAIHIGADELDWPGHAHLCVLRSCRDTLAHLMHRRRRERGNHEIN